MNILLLLFGLFIGDGPKTVVKVGDRKDFFHALEMVGFYNQQSKWRLNSTRGLRRDSISLLDGFLGELTNLLHDFLSKRALEHEKLCWRNKKVDDTKPTVGVHVLFLEYVLRNMQ